MELLVLNKSRCGGSAVNILHGYPWFNLLFLDSHLGFVDMGAFGRVLSIASGVPTMGHEMNIIILSHREG